MTMPFGSIEEQNAYIESKPFVSAQLTEGTQWYNTPEADTYVDKDTTLFGEPKKAQPQFKPEVVKPPIQQSEITATTPINPLAKTFGVPFVQLDPKNKPATLKGEVETPFLNFKEWFMNEGQSGYAGGLIDSPWDQIQKGQRFGTELLSGLIQFPVSGLVGAGSVLADFSKELNYQTAGDFSFDSAVENASRRMEEFTGMGQLFNEYLNNFGSLPYEALGAKLDQKDPLAQQAIGNVMLPFEYLHDFSQFVGDRFDNTYIGATAATVVELTGVLALGKVGHSFKKAMTGVDKGKPVSRQTTDKIIKETKKEVSKALKKTKQKISQFTKEGISMGKLSPQYEALLEDLKRENADSLSDFIVDDLLKANERKLKGYQDFKTGEWIEKPSRESVIKGLSKADKKLLKKRLKEGGGLGTPSDVAEVAYKLRSAEYQLKKHENTMGEREMVSSPRSSAGTRKYPYNPEGYTDPATGKWVPKPTSEDLIAPYLRGRDEALRILGQERLESLQRQREIDSGVHPSEGYTDSRSGAWISTSGQKKIYDPQKGAFDYIPPPGEQALNHPTVPPFTGKSEVISRTGESLGVERLSENLTQQKELARRREAEISERNTAESDALVDQALNQPDVRLPPPIDDPMGYKSGEFKPGEQVLVDGLKKAEERAVQRKEEIAGRDVAEADSILDQATSQPEIPNFIGSKISPRDYATGESFVTGEAVMSANAKLRKVSEAKVSEANRQRALDMELTVPEKNAIVEMSERIKEGDRRGQEAREQIKSVDKMLKDIKRGDVTLGMGPGAAVYRFLTETNIPKEVQRAYKLMKLSKARPGELFPLYAKPEVGTPQSFILNQWQGAEIQRPKIGGRYLAERPGIHAIDLPIFSQGKGVRKGEARVWVEVEMPKMSRRTQVEADGTPLLANGQKQGIRERLLGPDEAYNFQTNPNATGPGTWPIAGSMRAVRILSDSSVSKLLKDAGAEQHISNSMTNITDIMAERLNKGLTAVKKGDGGTTLGMGGGQALYEAGKKLLQKKPTSPDHITPEHAKGIQTKSKLKIEEGRKTTTATIKRDASQVLKELDAKQIAYKLIKDSCL